jgi:hypothetical protein
MAASGAFIFSRRYRSFCVIESLLMSIFPTADLDVRTKAALDGYEREIGYYRAAARLNYCLYWILQSVTIALGPVTPILLLIDGLPKVVQSIPAVLAGIAAALNGSFDFRDDYCRHSYTTNALFREHDQFIARAGNSYGIDKSDDEVLSAFAQRIAQIADGEAAEWQSQFLKSKPKSNTTAPAAY